MTGPAPRSERAAPVRTHRHRDARASRSIIAGASSTTIPAQRARFSARFALGDGPWTPARIARGAALALVAVGCAAGVVQVRSFVERSPDIAIHAVSVTGLPAESPRAAEILAYADVPAGVPFFAVDPAVVAARVARHPYVGSVDVVRVPPDRLEIRVVERSAEATLRVDEDLYLVDADGDVMKRLRPDDLVDVPLLSLLPTSTDDVVARPAGGRADPADPVATQDRVPPRLLDALGLLRAAESVGFVDRISEVVERPAVGFELVLDDGARVRLGNDLFETKLRRLRATEEKLRANGRRFSFMYLDDARHPERVAVRLRPVTETSPAGG
jgi:cell division protein FtsQ